MKKKRMFMSILFAVLVISILTPITIGIAQIYGEVLKIEKIGKSLTLSAQNDLLDMVIRQSKLRAFEFQDSFNEYQRIHSPEWFKKKDGGYVFHSIEKDEDFIFDPDSMILEKTFNHFYKISDKETGYVFEEKVAPEWNREVLNDFLNITVRNTRLFGAEGDPIIIDQRTKEILVDDSFNCADVPEVMGNDGERYMTLDWKHPNNANPEASKWVIDNILTWRNNQMWFYFFTAPFITVEDLEKGETFDFEEHPLQVSANIGREVGYTVVVEIKNEHNITLPLRVMFGAQEYEFTRPFKKTAQLYQEYRKVLLNNKVKIIVLPLVGLALIIILIVTLIVSHSKELPCMEYNYKRRPEDIDEIEKKLREKFVVRED